MTPGNVIALAAFALFVGCIAFGLLCDARRWWDERHWQADIRREQERLARLDCDPVFDAEVRVLLAMDSWLDVPHERKSA